MIRQRSQRRREHRRLLGGVAAILLMTAPVPSGIAAEAREPLMSQGPVTEQDGVTVTTLAEDLEHPWGMAWLPDDGLLITERPGRVRLYRDGRLEPEPLDGVAQVLAVNQGGLFDIALHPEFAENRLVYLTYAAGRRGSNRTQVARAELTGDGFRNWEVIFRSADDKPGGQHFGSRLLWLPDGTLLVSIGDGGNPPISFEGAPIRHQAQNPGTHFGSVVRLNDDGSVPEDNPFVGREGHRPAIWSYGHRNIQGLARDPLTGAIWASEHGARGGDELNQLQAGANFGWPEVTFSRNYGTGSLISPHTHLPGMMDPIVVWLDTAAPSGLTVYRGDAFPGWDGDLLSGSLVARDIRRITVDDSGAAVAETAIPIGERVRDVRQGPDGRLYVLTEEPDGRLLRLDPA